MNGSAVAAPDPRLRAAVVIPARDEAQRIGACLSALARQRGVAPEEFEVIVVLDGCRDATGLRVRELAAREPGLRLHTLEWNEPVGVGRARRAGLDLACQRLLSLGRPRGLLASTDADSVVADDWLACQLALVGSGAEAIGGHIELDPEEARSLPEGVLAEREQRAAARLQRVIDAQGTPRAVALEHHQFSGASLAITVEAYRRSGGLPPRAALEDEALEESLRRHDIPIHRSRAVRVLTSARTSGRAPRGLGHDLARSQWRARRSYRSADFPLSRLLEHKDASIALVLPARNVAETIGPIARAAARLRDRGLLDEVVVVDAASPDGTAAVAESCGVTVLQESELCVSLGPCLGKGDAMWRALGAVESDVVAFVDTDTAQFDSRFITGLVGPLVCHPKVAFVKAFFDRPFRFGEAVAPHDGGRVTELVARPLLNLHVPELAVFDQPLAGELAGRRELLDAIPFSAGYGVEIAMLIDAHERVGLDALAQVDLGVRQNRHQSLRDLSAMAYEVLYAAQARTLGEGFAADHAAGSLQLPPLGGVGAMETRRVTIEERAPWVEMRGAVAG